jgi:hypothetical protein
MKNFFLFNKNKIMMSDANTSSIFKMCPDATIDMALPAFSPCDPAQGYGVEFMLGASQFGFRPTVESLQYTVDSGNFSQGGSAVSTMSMARGAITEDKTAFVPLGLSRNGAVPKAYTLFSTPLSQMPGGY